MVPVQTPRHSILRMVGSVLNYHQLLDGYFLATSPGARSKLLDEHDV